MTKARARARAKARAVAKAGKPPLKGDKKEDDLRTERHDAKSAAMEKFGGDANIKSTAAAIRRGGARSR